MTDPYRIMCAVLLADYDNCHYRSELSDRARALLDQPEAEGPTDEEVDAWADQQGFIRGHGDHPCGFWIDDGDAGALVRAALTRWGNSQAILDSSPQPVPVSEGLPRPDDCDDEGYCWWWRTDEVGEWWEFLYLRDARDHNRRCGLAQYTHWLPYHAIPNLPNPND